MAASCQILMHLGQWFKRSM